MSSKLRTALLALVAVAVATAGGWVLLRRPHCAAVSCSSTSEAEVEPHLAVSDNGTLALAWMAVREQPERPAPKGRKVQMEADAADAIGLRLSLDAGRSWQTALRIEDPGRFAADPVLVPASGSSFDLVWLSFRQNLAIGGDPYDMRVRTTRIDKTAAQVIEVSGTDPDQQVDKPWAARSTYGKLLVVYRYATAVEAGIAFATVDSGSVQRTALVRAPGFAGGLPTLCMGESMDRGWVAYIDPSRGAVIAAVEMRAEWRDSRVSTDGERVAMEAPACLARGRTVWVLYGVEARPANPRLSALLSHAVIARSDDEGRTFKVRTELKEAADAIMHPTFAFGPQGTLVLAWYAGPPDAPGQGRVRWIRMREDGALEGQPQTLREGLKLALHREDPTWVGDYMSVASGSGSAWAAFGDNRTGRSHIDVAALP